MIHEAKLAIAAEAKERQRAALKQGTTPVDANLHQRGKGRTAERLAKLAGVSPRSVNEFEKVVKEAPELFDAMKNSEMTLEQAKKQIRDQKREVTREANRALVADTACDHCQTKGISTNFQKEIGTYSPRVFMARLT